MKTILAITALVSFLFLGTASAANTTNNNKSILNTSDSVTTVANDLVVMVDCVNLSQNLKINSGGQKDDITKLQLFLNKFGYLNVGATGYFGKLTGLAVQKFQTENSISPSGIVDTITRERIKTISCTFGKGNVKIPTKINPVVIAPKKNIQVEILATTTIREVTPPAAVVPPLVINPVKPFSLPFSTENFNDWTPKWGQVSSSTNKLSLVASPDLTISRAVYLPTKDLTDYSYSVNVLVKRGTVILIARYVDDKNFVACSFNGKSIDVIQMLNGNQVGVANTYLDDSNYLTYFYSDINLSITVKGNTVGCRQLGKEDNLVYKNIDNSLLKGAVGLQIWYESEGVAAVDLKKVTIQ